jgi:hypothetical protein
LEVKILSAPAAVIIMAVAMPTACSISHSSGSSQSFSPKTSSPGTPSGKSYWCDFVAQESLRQISGDLGALSEVREGWSSDQGLCLVRDSQKSAPMSVSWDSQGGKGIVQRQASTFGENSRTLPPAMGYGFEVKLPHAADNRPYYVISAFACGAGVPWLRIDLRSVRAGRDYVRDLEELLRIAEGRFGELHGCRPGPV